MQLQLQQATHKTHYGCLQAPTLNTLLLSQKMLVKTTYNTHSNFLLPMHVDSHIPQC
jgi:hypothetical protein